MAEIVMEDVSKVYPDGVTAVSDLSLEIQDGEFIVLVGPSGCGKTTALRMVAGLESITEGTIRIGERVVNAVPPKERDIAMVFQNYALYPHMSVFDNMAFGLKLRKLDKAEIDRRVREVDLDIADGEFVILVGPSGCGKSTTLNMIAGLEDITEGTLRIGGRVVNDLAPKERDVAMVFQSYALYPHMTVRENLGYGLKVRRAPKTESRQRVAEVAALLGLEELLERKPAQLSGGQRQRVAMGRAIVR
ncbi:MAG TPA: ATP-binding cassette domain-containing protein, partial [Actinomycetota bacterium]